MLESVRHRVPITVPVGTGIDDLVLEDNIPAVQVLQPKLLFINTHPTVDVTLTIVRRIDLGISADPEDDGAFDTTVVSAVTVLAANGEFIYEPPVNLIQDSTTPFVQHLIDLSHADLTETPIVQLLVNGIVESVIRTNLLTFSRQP